MAGEIATPTAERGPSARAVTLIINGQERELRIEPRVSLLDALREHLGLTGSEKGCDQGTCGACAESQAGFPRDSRCPDARFLRLSRVGPQLSFRTPRSCCIGAKHRAWSAFAVTAGGHFR